MIYYNLKETQDYTIHFLSIKEFSLCILKEYLLNEDLSETEHEYDI